MNSKPSISDDFTYHILSLCDFDDLFKMVSHHFFAF